MEIKLLREMSGYLKDLVSSFHWAGVGVGGFLPSHRNPDTF